MEQANTFKVFSRCDGPIALSVTPGHFVTSSSHINYYIDMTNLKSRRSEAHAAAKALSARYSTTTIIDTIVCLDGMNVIGGYLADELTGSGIMSVNLHNTMYVISPEQHSGGQLIFRDNYLDKIKNKHVLVLLASATTGKTLATALECIEYYGGSVAGISAIFSAADTIHGETVNAIFHTDDIPEYASFPAADCPLCQKKIPVAAIVNSHGYSAL